MTFTQIALRAVSSSPLNLYTIIMGVAGMPPNATLEVEEEGCGSLQFELPWDITDEEIAYIKSLVPRAE